MTRGRNGLRAFTFQDEFGGPAGAPPDPSRWSCDTGGGGWGNGELQVYADSAANAFQDGRSHLIIRATRPMTSEPSDAGWHVYRLSWTDNGMSFSRDGHTFLNVGRDFCPPPAWVFGPAEAGNGGMFMLLNLAVGGNAGEPPPGTALPADLMVDYIRVSGPELTPTAAR